MTLLLMYISLALGVSFLCSVLEAVLLSVGEFSLETTAAAGNTGARRMLDIKRNRIDDGITSILVLNTIAHTIGATMAGAQAAQVFGSDAVGWFSAVLTLAILVGTEIIPKTLGTSYADRLAGPAGNFLNVLTRALTPVLVVTRVLTRLISHREESRVSRAELSAYVAAARRHGALDREQWQLVSNILRIEEIRVSDVMTPRTVAVMLSDQSTLADLLAFADAAAFSRIPLFSDSRDHIVGYVLQRDALLAAAEGADRSESLMKWKREISFVPEDAALDDALEGFLERREPISIAINEFGGMSGIVTLEDVLETILGKEILDELDMVPDMRAQALALRTLRLARFREKRGLVVEPLLAPQSFPPFAIDPVDIAAAALPKEVEVDPAAES